MSFLMYNEHFENIKGLLFVVAAATTIIFISQTMMAKTKCNSTNLFSFLQLVHDIFIQLPTISIWYGLP